MWVKVLYVSPYTHNSLTDTRKSPASILFLWPYVLWKCGYFWKDALSILIINSPVWNYWLHFPNGIATGFLFYLFIFYKAPHHNQWGISWGELMELAQDCIACSWLNWAFNCAVYGVTLPFMNNPNTQKWSFQSSWAFERE